MQAATLAHWRDSTVATNAEQDRADLEHCEQRIVDGEQRILEQEARLASLSAAGHNTALFALLLDVYRGTLAVQYALRDAILHRLERGDEVNVSEPHAY